jgi:hypothetical protein
MKTEDRLNRQVLAMLDNRCVVFASDLTMPTGLRFTPDDTPDVPRISRESDVFEVRILETLKVAGQEVSRVNERDVGADLCLSSGAEHVYLEIKVREHEPRSRDYKLFGKLIADAQVNGRQLEVWHFDTDALLLTMFYVDGVGLHKAELRAKDVWERGSEGALFTRGHVVKRVDEWEARVSQLYIDVRSWLEETDASFVTSVDRTTVMSEELMQRYAVPERSLGILDVLKDGQARASLVPRGLWMIGADGRVDIITPDKTHLLVGLDEADGRVPWHLVGHDRKPEIFGKAQFLALVGG